MRQMLLLVFATSLVSVASKESGADFGFYPQNLESPLEGAVGRRRNNNGLSLLEILADNYFPSAGSGERNFGEPVPRRLLANAPERPFWSRLFAKDIKDSPVDAAQDSNLDRRKRYCCSLDMYCFLCYR